MDSPLEQRRSPTIEIESTNRVRSPKSALTNQMSQQGRGHLSVETNNSAPKNNRCRYFMAVPQSKTPEARRNYARRNKTKISNYHKERYVLNRDCLLKQAAKRRSEKRDEINSRKREAWHGNWGRKYAKKNRKKFANYLDKRRQLEPDKHYAQTAKACRKYRNRLQALRFTLLAVHGGHCTNCKIDDLRLLDFDHVDPETKSFHLSASSMSRPWDVLVAEAKKCQILCCNCHRSLRKFAQS